MDNLVFYDKEGNYLNFNWNDSIERYEGDLLFHENSNDTFKTQALYTFEKIKAFEFEDINSLTLNKWQLFNEYGFHFYDSNYIEEVITLIEPTNNRNDFFSKWIYGIDFHNKFKLGSLIRFNQPIFEFTNIDQLYAVVSSKKDAILIISLQDNSTFISNYPNFATYTYGNETISSVDVIGVYDYLDSTTFQPNLSTWNEPFFFNGLYLGKKLNIVNSLNNDNYQITTNQVPKRYIDSEIVTVNNPNLIDLNHYEWRGTNLPTNDQLRISVILKTDLPVIYSGQVRFYDSLTPLNIGGFSYGNVIEFQSGVPGILKPGVQFNVRNTTFNQQNYVVDSIPQFLGNANLIRYNEGTQVIWNNKIYQCIQTHDWVLNVSDVDLTLPTPKTDSNPDDANFWSDNPSYVPVSIPPTSEGPINADVFLTDSEFVFIQDWVQSSEITLSSAVDKFKDSLLSLNIDLMYENGVIRADLIYPSLYAEVNFSGVSSGDITTQTLTFERAIEIQENLTREFNYDFSENFSYDIVITDLDDFGIIVSINGEKYNIETQFIYSLGQVDMISTINQTLLNWYSKWNTHLLRLGIISTLQTINGTLPFSNSIRLETQYPNVPLDFEVQVGDTADFYIQNKRLEFYEPSQLANTIPGYAGASYSLGNYINIIVNNRSYGITHSLPNPTSDLSNTLQNWFDEYSDILDDFGIFVDNFPSSIEFRTKSQKQRCDIQVRVGANVLPGDKNYEIVNLQNGNIGTLLTSNEIILGTPSGQSLESAGFSTGMVVGINGTDYPLQNVQYNILFLDPGIINLSYEGPFWGLPSLSGPFNQFQFNNSFFNTTTASTITSTSSIVDANYYGSLDPNFIRRDYLWLHTQDFIRRPRANFNGDVPVTLYWKWYSDNVPEFFLYDFSGDLLPTTGVLSYNGPKPLTTVHLNRKPNREIDKRSLPEYQQTIFPIVYDQLSYIDDLDDLAIVPEPLETYIGFNSQVEGGLRSILQLYIKEDIDFTINTKLDTTNNITFETISDPITGERYGEIRLDVQSNDNFWNDLNGTSRGLKVGQHLAIFVTDVSNIRNQYISENNGYLVKIKDIQYRKIKVEFFKEIDSFSSESTIIQDYPKSGDITYLSVRLRVWDKEIGRFNVYGQTEIEDIRYKTELNNVGKLISSDDVYIFKEYDINEEGIDWVYLNRKRKEMLMMKSLIYPYIGSYKAIINAINYFGYNDLELYEYYRNINVSSKNYLKLFKVEIPDIFSPYVDTWNESDFLKNTFPNPNYEETNLFNLTYRITDREGNNILNYTLREVQIKLQGLKYWLQKNIIPITHKILDITGRADFVSVTTIDHIVRDINIIKVHEDFIPVSFKLNELYLMPVNNGSTVYNCVLDFYFKTGNNVFYSGVSQSVPDYYTVDIKTYQIYREWYPFKNYEIGDKVVYFDRLYQSVINNNKTNNPRKYENASSWSSGTIYSVGDVIEYQRDFYVYSGYGFTGSGLTGSTPTASVISPILDSGFATASWLNITEWKEIDLKPIQRITEFRRSDNLYPFNFTIDSNVDSYLNISVSSENGYGATYRDKKNYEIKGILDVRELESFSNLTSKQYINSVIPIINP
jgi:hypothetical protein